MRCLVVANAADADSGYVGHRLRHHGYALTEAHREHPQEWPATSGIDLVVLLGSEWSVYWDDVSVSVQAESALVRYEAARGTPILGVCFGAQMLAHALGGEVMRARAAEIGWFDIDSDVPDVIAPGPWLQWHYDTFRLPPDFQCLARSEIGPQVMQRGRILGTQFHPEVTETIVARWTSGQGSEELSGVGTTSAHLMDETRRRVEASRVQCNRLVDWFVENIAHS